ncbi:helix-turn-helix domain-containing protein [Candidatus Enterococcus mangumiae]|uniref:HTH cro/C1-type domain-containing protein n=1 Tax=Candidatus Enterococcus mangumiae TaxID=2230878 RepID=A0ABZ2T099_9ENTE|nr:helix-turn-helix transcriptional regulator [Enterococcus sp. DIV1094]MBO0491158.1 helix-turn-helix transcriptional regulator [Enterococcus sp. DIV1094]
MTIGIRIAELRKQKNMSQSDLAKALIVAPSTIGMWETDQRAIKDDHLKHLANCFNVSADYLLGTLHAPDWADINDLIELDKLLESNVNMSYGGEILTSEQIQRVKDILTSTLLT